MMLGMDMMGGGRRLPRNGLLLYLARPNSDEYLVGEDTETGEDTYIWGYVLPDDADIRAATGWASGTANVFYTATGVPIVALATEIAQAVLPANVVFSLVDATTQTGKLAIYTATTTAATLAKSRSILRDESINYLFYGRTAIVYDPQDLASMYQDAAGTLPVYRPGSGAVDPPVGLLLDKSGGGHHASQNTPPARPTLSGRYNLLAATETLSTQSVTTAATTYTLRFEGTGTATLSGTATGVLSAGTHTITCTAGTLTLTVAGTVTKADLRASNDGVGLPPYQRVDSATTYDTAGFPLYLKFDGVDDFLQTANVDLTGTDEVTVGTGIRKTGASTSSLAIFEMGSGQVGHIGAYCSSGVTNKSLVRVIATDNLSLQTAIANTARIPPATVVTVASFGGGRITMVDNGEAIDVGPYSSGYFKSFPLYIGSRIPAAIQHNGRIYSLCIIGSLLSTAEQAVLERYLNAKTRAY
jgi:hypothetical protein